MLLHPIAFAVALLITVYLHVVIGEMVPKNIALAKPDRVALSLTPALVLVVKIFQPIVKSFNIVANRLIVLTGVKPKPEIASAFTRDEVAGFVKESHREGLITSDEENLLSGALSFDSQKITSVLVPLDRLVTANETITPDKIEKLTTETGYSRFPIANKRGKLKGYVHIKDIIQLTKEEYTKPIPAKVIHELSSVKEQTSLGTALRLMQKTGTHISCVQGKDGKLIGVIYLEDVLEELVGEINDSSNNNK